MRLLRLNFCVTLIGFLDTHLLIPVIALYAASLGGSVGTVGLVVGVYSLSNTFSNVLGGRIVDRYGYRRPLIFGLLGDAAAMLSYVFCIFPWHLALVRLAHGFAGGFVGPSTMSSLANSCSKGNLGRALGIYGMAIALATLLGYGGGGLIASKLGYGFVFYTGAGLLLIATVLAFLMPAGKTISKFKGSADSNINTALSLLVRPGLRLPYTVIFSQYFAFGGIVALLPLYLSGLGLEAYHAGILLASFSISFIMVQFIGGRLADRTGRLKPALIGLLLASAGVALLPLPGSFTGCLVLMLVYGAGFGFIFPSVSAMVGEGVDADMYGMATGIFHALITAGVAIGAPLIGFLAGFTGIGWGLALCAAPLLLSLLQGIVQWRKSWL